MSTTSGRRPDDKDRIAVEATPSSARSKSTLGRQRELPDGTVDTRAGRVSAGLVALTFAALATAAPGWLGLAAAVFLVDYGGRAFTRGLGSPITWLAGLVLDALRVPPEPVPVVPMRWSVAVGAVLFSFVLALVEGNFMLPARILAFIIIQVTGAYAFAGFCTVGTIYSRIVRSARTP